MTNGTITPSTSFVVNGEFNYNGGTLSPVPTFTHSTANVTFNKAYALTATGTYTMSGTGSTLTLNGFDLTTGIFSSSTTAARSIAFGSNYIVLAHTTAATTVLVMASVAALTLTGTGGFKTDAAVTRTLTFGTTGGSTANAPNLTLTGSGTSVVTLTTGSWFNRLDFGTTAFTLGTTSLNLNGLTLSSAGTYTALTAIMVGTGTITPNGKTIAAFTINHSGTTTLAGALGCTTYTQTSGTVDFATFNLTCSSTAGVSVFIDLITSTLVAAFDG
jgi:hypothetical protein